MLALSENGQFFSGSIPDTVIGNVTSALCVPVSIKHSEELFEILVHGLEVKFDRRFCGSL